jgi:hypothetical protein
MMEDSSDSDKDGLHGSAYVDSPNYENLSRSFKSFTVEQPDLVVGTPQVQHVERKFPLVRRESLSASMGASCSSMGHVSTSLGTPAAPLLSNPPSRPIGKADSNIDAEVLPESIKALYSSLSGLSLNKSVGALPRQNIR